MIDIKLILDVLILTVLLAIMCLMVGKSSACLAADKLQLGQYIINACKLVLNSPVVKSFFAAGCVILIVWLLITKVTLGLFLAILTPLLILTMALLLIAFVIYLLFY